MASASASNKRIATNSVIMSVRMVVVLCLTFYATRAVLAALGVVDYGVYNVVCGFVSMFAFLNTSMSNGIQRFLNYELGKNGTEGANRVFCTAMLIQALLTILVIALTESFGLWYLENKMVIPADRFVAARWIFQFSIASFLFIIMQAPFTAAVIAHERMDFYAAVSVLDAVLKLAIVFLLPLLGGDALVWYGFLFMLISALNFALYATYSRLRFREVRLHRMFDRPLFRSMLGFSGWNLFGSLSGVAQEQGANLVLNFFFGPVVNAARGVAAQINGGLSSFVSNITMPVRPQVVQSYARGELGRTMSLTYSVSKFSCFFFAALAIPVSLEIDFVLRLWLGANVPEHTGAFTVLVVLSTMVNNLNSATSSVVHATGRMKHYQLWGSIVKMLSIPMAYVLLCYYDVPEIALACVFLMNVLGHTVCLFVVRTLVPLSLLDYLRRVVVPILLVVAAGLLCALPLHALMEAGWVRLICVTIAVTFGVGMSMYAIALEKKEKQMLKSLAVPLAHKIFPGRVHNQ
ncbi:MAG: hypothetical protein J6M53_07735 [Bacteroidaceae bacterium]|nr:hypothetical protein [Bacteroidaceae bacterium]